MRAKTAKSRGFTLVEVMIVVAIIGVLAAVAIPNFVRARETAQKNDCINTLRQIDGAAQTWAMENNKSPQDSYTLVEIMPYMKLTSAGEIPPCPAGGDYSPGSTVGDPPICAIPGHALAQ